MKFNRSLGPTIGAICALTGLAVLASASASASAAQTSPPQTPPPQTSATQTPPTPTEIEGNRPSDLGQTAITLGGKVGERQSAEETATIVEAMARIRSRVENRVENRIRNRIDRYYDPEADTATPFEKAEDRVRRGPSPR